MFLQQAQHIDWLWQIACRDNLKLGPEIKIFYYLAEYDATTLSFSHDKEKMYAKFNDGM